MAIQPSKQEARKTDKTRVASPPVKAKPAPASARVKPHKSKAELSKKPVAAKSATAKNSPKALQSKSSDAKTAAKSVPASKASTPARARTSKAAAPAAKPVARAPRNQEVRKAPAAPAPAVSKSKPGSIAPQKGAPKLIKGAPKPLLSRQFLFDLAQAIKEAVAPVAKAVKGREIVSTATSGDATFEIDRLAERALLSFLKAQRAPVAYYSEDSGYSTFSNVQPKHLLVVDPIDGTRAAKSGFEGCVIAIAATSVIERPTMADVDNACVMELLGDRTFYAERGKGARVYAEGHIKRPKLSENANLETMTWSMTVPARPAELIFPTAARLIDLTSLKGGFFACNSTSYSLTRLLTNQQDACIDFAGRYMHDIPSVVRDQFINAGRGVVLGIAPYDMAASLLIAQEAGCTVTNAYGKGFDNVLLLDSTESNHQSLIATSNAELHEKLLSYFDTRIKQFEELLKRRAQLTR